VSMCPCHRRLHGTTRPIAAKHIALPARGNNPTLPKRGFCATPYLRSIHQPGRIYGLCSIRTRSCRIAASSIEEPLRLYVPAPARPYLMLKP
jgi:hypothetical protein